MAQRPQPIAQTKILPRLSAPLTKLRKQWLSMVKDLEPQAALAVLRERLQQETEGATRLGNIAAQSWLVRQRLIGLQAAIHGLPVTVEVDELEPDGTAPAPDPAATSTAPAANAGADTPDPADGATAPQGPGWIKLRILVETEVNGMRFFEGSTIEVREDDARKLIEAKSAEPVSPAPDTPPASGAKPSKKAAAKK